jgi:hypothetical protein
MSSNQTDSIIPRLDAVNPHLSNQRPCFRRDLGLQQNSLVFQKRPQSLTSLVPSTPIFSKENLLAHYEPSLWWLDVVKGVEGAELKDG